MRDVRFALRMLRKSPGFTAVAVVTLAMAIGANAIVFSVMNALILRPLNVPQAESLYQLMRGKDKAGNQSFPDRLAGIGNSFLQGCLPIQHPAVRTPITCPIL